jgi:hypothetical protein
MKRASLKVTPTPAPTEPTDLTDRLLDREAGQASTAADAPAKVKRPTRRARSQIVEAEPRAAVEAAPAEPAQTAAAPSLAEALRQAQAASEALEAAAQTSPARYSVALRYRLEALAQHMRQVADFVNRLNQS